MKAITIGIILVLLAFTLGAVIAMKITLDKIIIDIRKIRKWIDKAKGVPK